MRINATGIPSGIDPNSVSTNSCKLTKNPWPSICIMTWIDNLPSLSQQQNSGFYSQIGTVPKIASDKPDEAYFGTRGGLEPQGWVLWLFENPVVEG